MNTLTLFAQQGLLSTVGWWAVIIIAVAAIVAVVAVALKRFNVQIPEWVKQIFWILVVAFVCIAAVIALMKFANFL